MTKAVSRGSGMSFMPTRFGGEIGPMLASAIAWDVGFRRLSCFVTVVADWDGDDGYEDWLKEYQG